MDLQGGVAPMTSIQATPADEPGFRGMHGAENYPLAGKAPVDITGYPGALIALEGTDSARSRSFAVFEYPSVPRFQTPPLH